VADDLLANRYQFGPHPTVTLPADPSWDENPLHELNWLFNYHSMRYVLALTTAWTETGDRRYLDRASFLLSDWYHDNPRESAPSSWAWQEHSTAWRAMVLVCAAEILPRTTWLSNALLLHGRTLADPDFYRGEGNHALNQDIGLLEVGCFLGRDDWMGTASRRLASLITASVQPSGATNEQSVYYEFYNYDRYRYAAHRLAECGQPIGPDFARVEKMPTFLAYATLPDGRYAPLGDTTSVAAPIVGTVAEFAATAGLSGPKPASTSRLYGAGFGFVRTGWGETRPFADEVMLTVRFGPARRFHGHNDGSSITLYGNGGSVILDSGQYSIIPSPYRKYFVSPSAHNVVTVDGVRRRSAETSLRWKRESPTMFEMAMTGQPYVGVTSMRRVTFSRSMGYVVVDDRVKASRRTTFRQLWHLREGTSPVVRGKRAWTRSEGSNVMILQVIAPEATRVITGATSPIQGWVSYAYGKRVRAPVIESRRAGTQGRFLTLLVPYASVRPVVSVTDARLTPGGYRLTVTVNGVSERVVAGATESRITPIP